MTRQKAEKQNEGNLEGRGTVERFERGFVVAVQKTHFMDNELYLSNQKKRTNKQTNKNKAREKKARSKRCVISRAGIDDRFTFSWLDRYFSILGPGIHDFARRLKNALILFSSFGPDLQEE